MNSVTYDRALQLYEPDPSLLYGIDAAAHFVGMSRRAILLCCKYRLVEGVLDPLTGAWFFDDDALRTLRRIDALRALCGGNLDAARTILALQDEVNRLRLELRFWRG